MEKQMVSGIGSDTSDFPTLWLRPPANGLNKCNKFSAKRWVSPMSGEPESPRQTCRSPSIKRHPGFLTIATSQISDSLCLYHLITKTNWWEQNNTFYINTTSKGSRWLCKNQNQDKTRPGQEPDSVHTM